MRILYQLAFHVLLSSVCWHAASVGATVIAGPVSNPDNGHAYYLLAQDTWTGAEAEAVSMSGHLATVRSSTENEFIFNHFSGLVPSAPRYRWLWIGLNEVEVEGDWKWVSGEPLVYSNWAADQPDDNAGVDEDFVGISLSHLPLGLWHDVSETNTGVDRGWGVVEVVPEPGSLAAIGFAAVLSRRSRRGIQGVSA
jgi:hypothetical protein